MLLWHVTHMDYVGVANISVWLISAAPAGCSWTFQHSSSMSPCVTAAIGYYVAYFIHYI